MNMLKITGIRPGIRAKQMICLALAITFLLLCFPVPMQAASKNAVAREAYFKALTNGKYMYDGSYMMPHTFIDINGDGIDELITHPRFGGLIYEIFTFLNGKIKWLLDVGQPYSVIKIYPSTHVIAFVGAGHMGYYTDTYYKISSGKATEVALMEEEIDFLQEEIEVKWRKYHVKGKETTKNEYNKYVKTLQKGPSFGHNELQWEYNLTANNKCNEFYEYGTESTTTAYIAYRALRTGYVYFALHLDFKYITKVQITLMNSDKKKANIPLWNFEGAFSPADFTRWPNPFTFSFANNGWGPASFACKLEKNRIYYLKVVTTNNGGYASSFTLENTSYQPYR